MALTPPTLDQVCEKALRLPCAPALLPRMAAVLAANNSTADDIAGVIQVDASLATATLRLANSIVASAVPVTTIAAAVVRLGQLELYRLAALALVSRWRAVTTNGDPGDFCRHSLCTALATEVLAEASERIDPHTGYTAGLVCDLGKLALAHACADFFPTVREQCQARRSTWADAEREVLGFTHAEVAGRLLAAWNFPPLLTAAAEFCESPRRGPTEAHALLAHLHAGKYVATSFGPGASEPGFLFELDTAFLSEWGFTPELLQETRGIVHDRSKQRLLGRLTYGAMVA